VETDLLDQLLIDTHRRIQAAHRLLEDHTHLSAADLPHFLL
jgi:hypothetical protein